MKNTKGVQIHFGLKNKSSATVMIDKQINVHGKTIKHKKTLHFAMF
ncbi:MAG: hypothetical protein GY782_10930 [Gammaproteobacteria bacterium]|nr:hypothetical protein [Gammaproteobacteria bacterium]